MIQNIQKKIIFSKKNWIFGERGANYVSEHSLKVSIKKATNALQCIHSYMHDNFLAIWATCEGSYNYQNPPSTTVLEVMCCSLHVGGVRAHGEGAVGRRCGRALVSPSLEIHANPS